MARPSNEELPFVDELTEQLEAPPEAAWESLLRMLRETMGSSGRLARWLGCEPAIGSDSFTGRPGETLPGFRVAVAEAGRRLELRGRHRFSTYALTFFFDGGQLYARTHAAFPGILGRLYRAAVIGTGGHRILTQRMLRRAARMSGAPRESSSPSEG